MHRFYATPGEQLSLEVGMVIAALPSEIMHLVYQWLKPFKVALLPEQKI